MSALRELERTGTTMESNVHLRLVQCTCGEYHISVIASRELVRGDVLVPVTSGDPQIIVQCDGSAHRMCQIGGAGAALLQFDGNGLTLLDWNAPILLKCADNIVAEANGADLAMHLYEKYVLMCHEQSLISLPLSRIHGDIAIIASSRLLQSPDGVTSFPLSTPSIDVEVVLHPTQLLFFGRKKQM